MSESAKQTVPDGCMRDAAGRYVPVANIKPEHLLEDTLVKELHRKALELSALMAQFKAAAFSEIGALQDVLADKHGAAKGGAKGNVTLSSYDGDLRVQLAIGDHLSFGPELQVAKELIDECLNSWSEGANPNIKAIINDAFDVGKEGKLRIDRILGLRRLAIDDPTWQRAMDAIGEALRVQSSSRYIRFYRRKRHEEKYSQLPLDFATV
jgi:arginine deiminase